MQAEAATATRGSEPVIVSPDILRMLAVPTAKPRRPAQTAPWHLVRIRARDHHMARVIMMREFEVYCPRVEEFRAITPRQCRARPARKAPSA